MVEQVKRRQVTCPQCGEVAEYSSQNPYRPFCSQRCQLIDLGDWAEERYRITDRTPPDSELT